MAAKRKQHFETREDLDADWGRLSLLSSQAKQGKLDKSKQVLLTTQLVEFNVMKHQYVPVAHIKERQYVKLDGTYTFENVYSSIWNHYTADLNMNLGIEESTHSMHLLIGKCGPRATDTAELCGKKFFLVSFVKKEVPRVSYEISSGVSVNHSAGSSALDSSKQLKNSIHKLISPTQLQQASQVSRVAECTIKKSVMPKLKLSMSDLMALGKNLPEVNWNPGRIRSLIFDKATGGFAWSNWTDILVNKGNLIGQGGFRDAFKCTVQGNSEFKSDVYVFKVFHPDVVKYRMANMSALNNAIAEDEAASELNMKAVQSLSLARILADFFREKLKHEGKKLLPNYICSWQVEFPGAFGTIEEYISGKFTKYLNNSMRQNRECSEYFQMAAAFAHFTYEYSEGVFLVTDIQGVGMTLTDPEVATKQSFSLKDGKGEMIFGAGNLPEALDNFFSTHRCNRFCKNAQLKQLIELKT